VYVGNKTSSDVSFFEVGNDGSLSLHQNFTSTQIGVASIAVAPTNQFLYVGGFQGATGGNAWGFNINAVSGDLSNVPGDPFSATLDPLTAMVVDPSSSFVFANSGDPHALYAFTIGSTGNLTEVANSPFTAGVRGGGIAVSPLGTSSGGFVYTADNTNSRVSAYSYDATGALTQITGSPYLSGASPQGIAVDPTGKYLYVTNFADDTVSSFSINAATGALTPIQAGATAVDTGGAGPVDVKVDPSNQFVYVVNQTDGSISTFTTSAGVLTLKGNADTGTSTKAVALAIL
jgi:6-phosphogluconolactonase